ncbi:hypothetical protein PI126_g20865 [Phytophthora idaei]|nr:hypothetical protein PI126_g20865 [Phytophthora idaei]
MADKKGKRAQVAGDERIGEGRHAAENPADIAEGEVRDTCGPFRGVFDSWDDGFGVQQIPTRYIPSL